MAMEISAGRFRILTYKREGGLYQMRGELGLLPQSSLGAISSCTSPLTLAQETPPTPSPVSHGSLHIMGCHHHCSHCLFLKVRKTSPQTTPTNAYIWLGLLNVS